MEGHISVTPQQARKLSRLSLSNHKRKVRHRQRPDESSKGNHEKRDVGCDLNSQTQPLSIGSDITTKQVQRQIAGVSNEGRVSCMECEKAHDYTSIQDDKSKNNTPEVPVPFKYKDSAYVQNLAEIAHDILNDDRWSVEGKPLFQWRSGESK